MLCHFKFVGRTWANVAPFWIFLLSLWAAEDLHDVRQKRGFTAGGAITDASFTPLQAIANAFAKATNGNAAVSPALFIIRGHMLRCI